MLQGVRPTTLGDNFRIGTLFSHLDLIIISGKGHASNITVDLLDVVHKFDTETVNAMFYTTVTILAILSAAALTKLGQMMASLYEKAWKMFEVVVDQENYNPRKLTQSIIWSLWCLLLFFILFGRLCNEISADMVAQVKEPEMDSIEDVLSGPFTDARLRMLKGFYFYDYLKNARIESDVYTVYRKMVETSDCSTLDTCNFIDFEYGRVSEIMQLFKRAIRNRKDGLLFNRQQLENMVMIMTCPVDREMTMNMHVSKKSIAEDILVSFYHRKISSEVSKYVDHRWQSRFELGNVLPCFKRLTLIEVQKMGFNYDWPAMKCVQRIHDHDHDQITESFKLNNLKKTYRVCTSIIVSAICTICLEFVINKINQSRHRRKYRRSMQLFHDSLSIRSKIAVMRGIRPMLGPLEINRWQKHYRSKCS